jgi:hypothetical protein
MSAQMALKQEEVRSRQDDFAAAPLLTNGNQLQSLPNGFYDTGGARDSEPRRLLHRASETLTRHVDLIASTLAGVTALPMIHEAEFWPNDRVRRLHFFDEEKTLELDFSLLAKKK